jgi:hypothetical protein
MSLEMFSNGLVSLTYKIDDVTDESICGASSMDKIKIQMTYDAGKKIWTFDKFVYDYKSSGVKAFEDTWNNVHKTLTYDPIYDQLRGTVEIIDPTGSSIVRSVCISLDRKKSSQPRIHVYVGGRVNSGGGTHPDDGSWTGHP